MRSVSNVMAELRLAKEKYRPRYFSFPDDTFTTDKAWLKEFIGDYKRDIGRPFLCYTHPKFIDYERAALLKEGGCFWLNIGIQTASEDNRKKILKRVESNEEILKAARNCHKTGLRFSIDHIFDIPGEGEREYIEALSFYNKLRPSIINSFFLRYYPKTEIIDTALSVGMLKEEDVRSIEEGEYFIAATMSLGTGPGPARVKSLNGFVLLFSALPFLPPSLVDKIIARRWDLKLGSVPQIFSVLAKFIVRLGIGQWYLYTDEIKRQVFFAARNLRIKLGCYFFGKGNVNET